AVLNAEPTDAVTVSVDLPDQQLITSPASLVFDATNWSAPQRVTVTAVGNNSIDGNRLVTIDHSVASGDPQFDGISAPSMTVDAIDDAGALVVSGTNNANQIAVLFSASLIQVVVDRKSTFYPATYSQVLILAGDGNDTIQLQNPSVPVAVLAD